MGRKEQPPGDGLPVPNIFDVALLRLGPLVIALYALFRAIKWFWGFVQDDTYISLRYSWNFAHGNGLVFNIGEKVEGFSNFLWVIFAGVMIKIGVDPLDAVRVVGV